MDGKPLHFDGSAHNLDGLELEANNHEEFAVTDEIRKNISGNPYIINKTE